MELALSEARAAAEQGEVPVGAIAIVGGLVVASRHNEREHTSDPTAHAEMLALRDTAADLAPPERLHFTAADLELTVDFFHHGMAVMVGPGDKVLILMPGDLPGSVGNLLVKGLARLGVTGFVHGLVRDPRRRC